MSDSTTGLWWFYLVRCSDGSLYAGVARDPEARVQVHNSGKGARYTRSRQPVTLLYCEAHPNRSAAQKREAEVKQWPRWKKKQLTDGSGGGRD